MSIAHNDVSEFFRTCSIRDLQWFAKCSADYFLNLAASSSTVSTETFEPKAFIINRDERTIPFPLADSGKVSAAQAFAAFVRCLLSSASWDNKVETAKQSRIRCRNTSLIALDLIYTKLEASEHTLEWVDHAKEQQSEILFSRSTASNVPKSEDVVESNLPLREPSSPSGSKKHNRQASSVSKAPPAKKRVIPSTLSFPDSQIYTRPPITPNNKTSPKKPVTLVIPSAGRSSRFPGHKPKWLLTQPNGRLMVVDALGGLDLSDVTRVVIGVLREHVNIHCGGEPEAILAAFADGPEHLHEIEIALVVIEKETIDQVQTIEAILAGASVTGPIFLKDCDNQFACPVRAVNGVATLEMTKETLSISIPAGKSYVSLTPAGVITNIVEKVILGNTFCVGGYSFSSAESFQTNTAKCRSYQALTSSTGTELAVSDIIWLQTLTTAETFVSIPVHNYEDWGTLDTWLEYTRTFKTLFCDIDGTLLKNSGQYFVPRWGSQPALQNNVEHLKKLHKRGRTQIILTTTRPESLRELTVKQLEREGVPYDKLVLGLWHGQRAVINDYAKTNPFPSAVAVNLKRNADDLKEHLEY
jgi:hypothetical protein